jgi:nucleoside-diphosphate-sugar epimerase
MQEAHLITGGTGFVGSALILELLARTPLHVVAVVRPSGGDVQARLLSTLRTAAEAYGAAPALVAQLAERCTAVAGDVAEPACGVAALPEFVYTQMWHSAASLRFEDRYEPEIRATNIEGTRHALALAAQAGVEVFNYVSTAYVAGAREGAVPEAPVAEPRPNNQYEASKIVAEALVAADGRFGVRILRPSIVIGHSETYAATNFTGMYGFLRKLVAFEGMMARTQRGLVQERAMRILADGDAHLDLVPIDHVAADAVTAALRPAPPRGEAEYFHLTNPLSVPVAEALDLMFDTLQMARPVLVNDRTNLEWLDEKFNERIDFYQSYIRGNKRFDRSAIDARVDFVPERRRLDRARLTEYYRWYLDRVRAERAALPVNR